MSDKVSYRSLDKRGGRGQKPLNMDEPLTPNLHDENGRVAPGQTLSQAPTAELLLPDIVNDEIERADAYARAARSNNTQRAYMADWLIFTAWCAERGECPLPTDPEVVRRFVSWEADRKRSPSTIERRVAAIGHFHRAENLVAPTAQPGAGKLRETMAGIRATLGTKKRQKSAADAAILQAMFDAIPGDGLRPVRDRALLAIGMAAALRRSELVALQVDDIALVPEGLRITIKASKTDPTAQGVEIAVPEGTRLRPKARLLEWMNLAAHTGGALFRRLTRGDELTGDGMSDRAVARLVQGTARKMGLDERQFGGHSLRAGFLTESAARGATVFKMQEVSRHKTVQILSEYVRSAEKFKDHAGSGFL
jgi:site-specific recombinase XerD